MKIPRVVWRYTNPNSEDPREGQFFDVEEHFEVFPTEVAKRYNDLAGWCDRYEKSFDAFLADLLKFDDARRKTSVETFLTGQAIPDTELEDLYANTMLKWVGMATARTVSERPVITYLKDDETENK